MTKQLLSIEVPDEAWDTGTAPSSEPAAVAGAPLAGTAPDPGPDYGDAPEGDTPADNMSADDAPGDGGTGGSSVSVAASGNQQIDGLLRGVKRSGTSITYATPDSASDHQAGYVVDNNGNGVSAQNEGFGQLSAQQLAAVHFALNYTRYTQPAGAAGFSIGGFTNSAIDYAGSDSGTIRVANTSDNTTGFTYYPSSAVSGGDAWLGTSIRTPTAGNYSWNNTLHELGHAMGLKHGQDTGVYGALPSAVDSLEFTVMTYRSYVGAPASRRTAATPSTSGTRRRA